MDKAFFTAVFVLLSMLVFSVECLTVAIAPVAIATVLLVVTGIAKELK